MNSKTSAFPSVHRRLYLRLATLIAFTVLVTGGIAFYLRVEQSKEQVDKEIVVAACKGQLDRLRLLTGSGAEIDSKLLETALQTSLRNGHLACADYLIAIAQKTTTISNDKPLEALLIARAYGPLNTAASDTRVLEIAKKLLVHGANVEFRGEHGCTPLHWASAAGSVRLARELIERGAPIDSRSNSGATPLYIASVFGQVDSVRFLLNSGANVSITGVNGLTPLAAARSHSKTAIVKVLQGFRRPKRRTSAISDL